MVIPRYSDIFIAGGNYNSGGSWVVRYSRTGELVAQVVGSQNGVPGLYHVGLGVDNKGSTIWSSGWGADYLYKFRARDLAYLGSVAIPYPYSNDHGEGLQIIGDRVYFGNADGFEQICEYNTVTKKWRQWTPGRIFRGSDFIWSFDDGKTFFYNSESDSVFKYDTVNDTTVTILKSPTISRSFYGLVGTKQGTLAAAGSGGSDQEVVLFTQSGTTIRRWTQIGNSQGGYLFAIGVDTDGSHLWTARFSGSTIWMYRWHVDTPNNTVITPQFSFQAPNGAGEVGSICTFNGIRRSGTASLDYRGLSLDWNRDGIGSPL